MLKTFSFSFDGRDNFFENNIASLSSYLESGWFILEDKRTTNEHVITLENSPVIRYFIDKKNGKNYNDGKSKEMPLKDQRKVSLAISEAIEENENKTFLVFVKE